MGWKVKDIWLTESKHDWFTSVPNQYHFINLTEVSFLRTKQNWIKTGYQDQYQNQEINVKSTQLDPRFSDYFYL